MQSVFFLNLDTETKEQMIPQIEQVKDVRK